MSLQETTEILVDEITLCMMYLKCSAESGDELGNVNEARLALN